jgi:hypothetical protein
MMAKTKKVEDVGERMLKKLTRIEDLLVNLVAVEGCAADANRIKLARLLGVDNGRVSRVSSALKRKKGKEAK